jgi:3-hydroxyacyl-CoA dehydrogenase
MKPNPDESYESWCQRVRMYEHGAALQRLAQGEDIAVIMQDMSRKIEEKLLHPLYKMVERQYQNEYNPEQAKQNYREQYLDRTKPAADHVEE